MGEGLGAGGAFFLASAQLRFLYSTFESCRSFSVPNWHQIRTLNNGDKKI